MTTHLERELREQPDALRRLLDRQSARAEELASLFRRRDVRYIVIASRGSSSNAARYAQYLLGRANRAPVGFATPSLYTLYEQPPRLDGALVIGISQSGGSPDVKAVIEEARRQGRPTLALTNDPVLAARRGGRGGAPARGGRGARGRRDEDVPELAGRDRAPLRVLDPRPHGARRAPRGCPDQLEAQLARSFADTAGLERYAEIAGGTVVARGINYGTSFEVALKIRELSGLLFEAYSAADLMHGPIAAIGRGWPVIALAPSGPAFASMIEAVDALAARGARLIVASDVDRALALAETPLPLVPDVPEWLSPLVAVVPGQIARVPPRRAARRRHRPAARPLEGHADPVGGSFGARKRPRTPSFTWTTSGGPGSSGSGRDHAEATSAPRSSADE